MSVFINIPLNLLYNILDRDILYGKILCCFAIRAEGTILSGKRATAADRLINAGFFQVSSCKVFCLRLAVEVFCHIRQARSSGVEHYLDTVGVGGSKPPVPTIFSRCLPCRRKGPGLEMDIAVISFILIG